MVQAALESLRDYLILHNIKQLAMPRIATGLDRLPFPVLLDLLHEVFKNCDLVIYIYSL